MARELVAIPVSQYETFMAARESSPTDASADPSPTTTSGPKIPPSVRNLIENILPFESRQQAHVVLQTLERSPRFSLSPDGELKMEGKLINGAHLWDLLNVYFRQLPPQHVPGYTELLDLLRSAGLPPVPQPPRSYIGELEPPSVVVKDASETRKQSSPASSAKPPSKTSSRISRRRKTQTPSAKTPTKTIPPRLGRRRPGLRSFVGKGWLAY